MNGRVKMWKWYKIGQMRNVYIASFRRWDTSFTEISFLYQCLRKYEHA